MIQVSNRSIKPLHQKFSDLDNKVFSAFCQSFNNISWIADYKDNTDSFCGIDLQLTAMTKNKETTYDIEIKSVHLNKFLDYCYFQWDKWFSLIEWDNDYKLYAVIYPNHNKIAVWRINRQLFEKSEKDFVSMKTNTCKGGTTKDKLVYKLKLTDAKVFDFNLADYKDKYSALYKEVTKKG